MLTTEAPAETQQEPRPMIPEVESSQPQDTAGTEAESIEQDAPEAAQKLSIKDLAEKLGTEAAAVYDQVEVLPGITLGQYKDRARDLQQSEELLAEARENRAKVESELLLKNQALRIAQQEAGIEITPELIERAAKQTDQYKRLQDRIAVELMPEWAEESVRHEAEKRIDVLLDEYGYQAAEKPFMVDARLRKMFRDYARLRDEVAGVAARKVPNRKGQKPSPRTRTGGNVTNLARKVAEGAIHQNDAVSALGRLLKD